MAHPIWRDLLDGLGRAAVRAGAKAIDSMVTDAKAVTDDVSDRLDAAAKEAARLHERSRTGRKRKP